MDFMYRWALFVAVAVIALVALANIVWGQEGDHDDFHWFYQGQNGPRGSCCLNDCAPVQYEWRDGVLYLGLFRNGEGDWAPAADETMMAVPSPDWQYHACWPFYPPGNTTLRCWWAPGLS